MSVPSQWPEIPFDAWKDTHAALHQYMQVVGKYRLAYAPWLNHSWHATFYLNARGWTTGLIHCTVKAVQIDFDLLDDVVAIRTSDGEEKRIRLEPMSVSTFHQRFLALVDELGVGVDIDGTPNEIADAVPFAENTQVRPWDGDAVRRFWQALLQAERVFRRFRTGFLGKCSPVHLFWGSFDLAVTRFSGRKAPPHPGGFPGLPDEITREAYSHEVSSAGFWAGGDGMEAAFYAYAYPEPKGFALQPVKPSEAFYGKEMSEFFLPYEAVRTADDPDAALMSFLQTTYEAAAKLGEWDRDALEAPLGVPGVPRKVE